MSQLKKLLIFPGILVYILIYAFFPLHKFYYLFVVNKDIKEQISADLINTKSVGEFPYEIIGSDIIQLKYRNSPERTPTVWDNMLVAPTLEDKCEVITGGAQRCVSQYLIKVSADNGQNWKTLVSSDKSLCDYGVVWKDNLICISGDIYLDVVHQDGQIISRELAKPATRIGLINMRAVYKKSNELILVWEDNRSQFPTIGAFIPIPGKVSYGPYLTMVGKLNLDTLEFKKYIIQYGPREFCYAEGKCF